jgi:outer membrane receptor protein involved in Fe transport
MGNPLLRPEYTNSIEAGQLTNWDTGSLLTSIYYRHRTGVIERITRVDSLGISNIYPVNMAKQNAYGIELNASNTIQNWWRINANFNFYRAITNGTYLDKKYGSDTYTWTSRVTSKMTIVKSLDFQAGINYRGAQNILQGRRLPSYSVDLALAKDLFKGNGTATISVRDLFQTRRWRTILDEPGYYSNANNLWNGRQILLTLNFRLNRSKETRTNDNSGGGMDEDN